MVSENTRLLVVPFESIQNASIAHAAAELKRNPPKRTWLQTIVGFVDGIFWLTVGGIVNPRRCEQYREAYKNL